MNENRVKPTDHLADFTRDKRILVLSLMAVVIGAISALVAYALVWLIDSRHYKSGILPDLFGSIYLTGQSPAWLLGYPGAGSGRFADWLDGSLGVGADSRTWDSRSAGGYFVWSQPDGAKGRPAQTPLVGPLNWHGRSFRSRGSHHYDRRHVWFAVCPAFSSLLGRAQNPAGSWRSRRDGGHLCRTCRRYSSGAGACLWYLLSVCECAIMCL